MAKNSKKTAQSNSALSRNINVFVEGVTFTRSFSHPYLAERIDPLWVMRDAPRHNAKAYRDEEWCAYKTPAVVVDKLVRAHSRGSYAICAFHPIDTTDETLRAEYKKQGYHLNCAESVMVHTLKQIPSIKSPARIQRVLTTDLADAVNQLAPFQQILPEHLTDIAPIHLYAALIEGAVVGWVSSIKCQHGSWAANLFVLPEYRRQKIASALLAQLMRDERKRGIEASVLTTSKECAKLYAILGYQSVGTLLLFTPQR
jgi:GNAT superfamily N-acetyltransferase